MSPRDLHDTRTAWLFDGLPEVIGEPETMVKAIRHPVWTSEKARLIERYLYYFVQITRHGTYIDGFAGPQEPERLDMWSAKLVLESRPRWLRNFYLCDLDDVKAAQLTGMVEAQPPRDRKKSEPKRHIRVMHGDFNDLLGDILAEGKITEKEAAFALLDQRTLECKWETVKKLAEHKKSGHKIELFYFLPMRWLHRAISSLKAPEEDLATWWGRADWADVPKMSQSEIRDTVRDRFMRELGYKSAKPWPIYESESGGAVMYYMLHATDHPEAPKLMWRAYDRANFPPPPQEQLGLDLAPASD
jgi:three-Cys-motif partner protein